MKKAKRTAAELAALSPEELIKEILEAGKQDSGDIELTIPSGRVMALSGARPPDVVTDELQNGDLIIGKLNGKDVIYWCNGTTVYPLSIAGMIKLLTNGGLAFGGDANDELFVNLGPGVKVDTVTESPTYGKIIPDLGDGLVIDSVTSKIVPDLGDGIVINATSKKIEPNLGLGVKFNTENPKQIVPNIATGNGLVIDGTTGEIKVNANDFTVTMTPKVI
jgi:hypothetical protein